MRKINYLDENENSSISTHWVFRMFNEYKLVLLFLFFISSGMVAQSQELNSAGTGPYLPHHVQKLSNDKILTYSDNGVAGTTMDIFDIDGRKIASSDIVECWDFDWNWSREIDSNVYLHQDFFGDNWMTDENLENGINLGKPFIDSFGSIRLLRVYVTGTNLVGFAEPWQSDPIMVFLDKHTLEVLQWQYWSGNFSGLWFARDARVRIVSQDSLRLEHWQSKDELWTTKIGFEATGFRILENHIVVYAHEKLNDTVSVTRPIVALFDVNGNQIWMIRDLSFPIYNPNYNYQRKSLRQVSMLSDGCAIIAQEVEERGDGFYNRIEYAVFAKLDANGVLQWESSFDKRTSSDCMTLYSTTLVSKNDEILYVTEGDACDQSQIYFYKLSNLTTTSVDNPTISKEFHVYPNPVEDFIHIPVLDAINSFVQIRNVSGKLVYDNRLPENGTIDLSRLQAGLYIVSLETEKGTSLSKFIKI